MPTLLVIDDEPDVLLLFRAAFGGGGVTLLTATSAAEGLAEMGRRRPDVIILDILLPGPSGLEAFKEIHARDPRVPVIFITSHGTAETAIEAMRLGAYDYLLKPLDLDNLREVVGRAFAISRLMSVPALVPEPGTEEDRSDLLIGHCPAMQQVYKSVGRVAPQDVTVLLRGESGTGKELVARAIYHYSRRGTGPFLAINCAAIPEALLESELFGHEKGAFTGADRRRIGKFEQCSGGTLFLDEIGDMSPVTQAKVLRVLQDQQFQRVGSNEAIQADVRLIAATNRDLDAMVAAGTFRNDLYYRLNVYTIPLPPLRERREDLPEMVEYFLKRFNHELGKEVRRVAPESMAVLEQHAWPGNVRELQSVLKQALLEATGPVLAPEFLPAALRKEAAAARGANGALTEAEMTRFVRERLALGHTNLYEEFKALTERFLFQEVLA
ncbi:MAG TPA: sigma-54 dependent transcriptional regulator, partial [Gemmataceae bacterium]|nr:sigma-54 dependent transcriptional regulator [Gemmataceae bacterium]